MRGKVFGFDTNNLLWFVNNFDANVSVLVELLRNQWVCSATFSCSRLSVSQSKINKITHKGWEMPLVNKIFARKGESGRWIMEGSDGLWKRNPMSTIVGGAIVTMDAFQTFGMFLFDNAVRGNVLLRTRPY